MTGAFLRAVSPGAMALRVLVFLGPVGAVLLTAVQGPGPRPVLVVAVAVLAAVAAVRPESPLLLAALALSVGWWALATRDGAPVAAVPAAWLVLAAHVSATVVSLGPRELPVDRATLLLWARRALLLATLPPLLWAVSALTADRPDPGGVWLAAMVVVAVVCAAAGVLLHAPRAEEAPARRALDVVRVRTGHPTAVRRL